MKENLISALIVGAVIAAAIAGLWWWFAAPADVIPEERIARSGETSVVATKTAAIMAVNIEGEYKRFDGVPSELTGAWPRFRGADFDNINKESVKIAENWGEQGPPVLWSVDLGEGYAGPAVLNGRVYLMDYDEKTGADSLRCFSLDDGREIWRRWYKVRVKRNHGMSRAVPAVTAKYVVAIGPRCHVLCADPENGAFMWGLDLVKDFGAAEPLWYTGQCPLIDGTTAVIAPGGKALMMGVDCQTGKIAWETPNPRKWLMSHSSVMPMTFNGRRMYVYCAIGGMAGVSADEEDRGAVLWETTEWSHSVVAPSPVVLDDGRIFVTAGYGVGSAMFKVTEEGGKFSVKQLYKLPRKIFACEHHTPICYEGHLFTVLPNDAEAVSREFACMDLEGKVAWLSGKENRYGLGPFLLADGKIFVMNDDGVLTLIRASSKGFEKLAQAKVLKGPDSWGPMALVNGRLLLRDLKRMICLDVRGKE